MHVREQNRAQHGPREIADAPDIGHQQNKSGRDHRQGLRGEDLVIDCSHAASKARKSAGKDENQIAHPLRIIAHKLHPLRIVAHRLTHLAQRRTGKGKHRNGSNQRPGGNEPVDLIYWAKTETEQLRPVHAVTGDALLAAKEAGEHEAGSCHQFGKA